MPGKVHAAGYRATVFTVNNASLYHTKQLTQLFYSVICFNHGQVTVAKMDILIKDKFVSVLANHVWIP